MEKDFHVGILFHNNPKYFELHSQINDHVDAYEIVLGQYATEPDVIDEIKELGKPLILHTNLLSPGSYNGVSRSDLQKVNSRVDRANALWVGDHMCYSKIKGIESGGLLSPFLIEEELSIYEKNINVITKELNCPLLLENVIMFYNPLSEMSLGEFFTKLTERTSAGIILSLENISQCQFYHNLDHYEFIESLPLEKVVQLHCTLGNIEEQKQIPSFYEKQLKHFEVIKYLAEKKEFSPKSLIWELETETPSLASPDYIVEKIHWARELFANKG
ncbi:DUF692 family multinuclear iron-containing protein [Bacillus gobiensis]|uniref:multinuclear nonheme iron-dependent oxidase n=1 Tax=Bacillus gobiensis TaxID=1441095 RepID=UPI003D198DD2